MEEDMLKWRKRREDISAEEGRRRDKRRRRRRRSISHCSLSFCSSQSHLPMLIFVTMQLEPEY